eukprot:1016948-Pyramimonas_sp.AAC.1
MRPVPPRSAAEAREFQWKRGPSLIHAPLVHVCDRLIHGGQCKLCNWRTGEAIVFTAVVYR